MVGRKDTEEVLGILLTYLPSAAALQLLGDLARSKAAEHNASLAEMVGQLVSALSARGPVSYAQPARTKGDSWRKPTV